MSRKDTSVCLWKTVKKGKRSRSSLDVPQLSQKLRLITKSEKVSLKTSRVTAELKLVASDGPERTRLKTRVVEVEGFSQQQVVLVEWEGLRGEGGASAVNY